jgi:transposase-like protein
MQSARSSRYSEKFRAGVVRRVLDGKQTLGQIAHELDLPQADILIWVAQQFDQKQHQIEQLSETVKTLRQFVPDQVRIDALNDRSTEELKPPNPLGSGDVIEGRVN